MTDTNGFRTNVYKASKERRVAHDGDGTIGFVRPFNMQDFDTAMNFIDYVEIPPAASIGYHTHELNEEIYFIVEGSGSMTVNNEEFPVSRGDIITNRIGWSHGLKNTSAEMLRVLVWEVAYDKQ